MRLVIADDHAVFRQGLRAQFEQKGTAEILGEAANGEEAVALATGLSPDAIIMDIIMPRLGGVEAIRQIHLIDPAIKLVVLSMLSEHGIVIEALKAGCHAYLTKAGTFGEVTAALEAVTRGERYLSPEITRMVVEDFIDSGIAHLDGGLKPLSPRERQVLQMTAEGLSVKEIARDLQLSAKTIDNTRRKIMQKLDEHSVAGLTKFAIRQGLTSAQF